MSPVTTPPRPRRLLPVALLAALAAMLLAAPSALADTTSSSNWAGYAAHSSKVKFTRVFGAWRQPTATCTPGQPTYSSEWVGLGGFYAKSNALEQIGSELDCNASGKVVSSVWYELVPAPSRDIRMRVDPGDQLTASVSVTGRRVTLILTDLTRHKQFSRTVTVHQLDLTSADWIVEAPSECSDANACQQLALANFGTTAMTRASTRTSTGHRAAIADPRWMTTEITLSSAGRRFVGPGGSANATAVVSNLVFGGTAFAVTYQPPGGSSPPSSTTSAQTVRSTALARPGRR